MRCDAGKHGHGKSPTRFENPVHFSKRGHPVIEEHEPELTPIDIERGGT